MPNQTKNLIALQTFIEHSAILIPILLVGIFLILTYLAIRATRKVLLKEEMTTDHGMLANAMVPGVSLIIPIYNNGGHNIVPTISSLFELQYTDIEIILVNDGSTDNSLQWMIKAFELQKVHFSFPQHLATQPIKGVYKSSNTFFKKLTIIDKQHGGIADALNTGINAANYPLFVNVDIDAYLSKDALKKMVKAWLDVPEKSAAAIVNLRPIYNSSKLADTDNDEVTLLERSQVIEYMRTLLISRIPFFKKTGTFSQPSLFVLFNKETCLELKGYQSNSYGTNNDLLIRLYQHIAKEKTHKIKTIQSPVCWLKTANHIAPFIQKRQYETQTELAALGEHKNMLFNPKYGLLGFFNYPFWVLHKLLLPIFVISGFIYLFVQLLLVNISLLGVCYLMLTLYLIIVLVSSTAILFEDQVLGNYKNNQGTIKLLLTALIDPLYYFPLKLWAKVKGFFRFISKQDLPPPNPSSPPSPNSSTPQSLNSSTPQSLNSSTPQSLNSSTPQSLNSSSPQSLNPSVPESLNPSVPLNWLEQHTKGLAFYVQKNEMAKQGLIISNTIQAPDYRYLYSRFWEGIQKYTQLNISLLILLLISRAYEYFFTTNADIALSKYELLGGCYDILFMGKMAAICFLPFIVLYLFLPKLASGTYRVISLFLAICYFFLVDYFAINLAPLGIEWANYTTDELIEGLGQASAIGIEKLIIYGFVIITFPFIAYLVEKIKFPTLYSYPFYIILLLSIFFYLSPFANVENTEKDLPFYTYSNKLELFIDQNFD